MLCGKSLCLRAERKYWFVSNDNGDGGDDDDDDDDCDSLIELCMDGIK